MEKIKVWAILSSMQLAKGSAVRCAGSLSPCWPQENAGVDVFCRPFKAGSRQPHQTDLSHAAAGMQSRNRAASNRAGPCGIAAGLGHGRRIGRNRTATKGK
ncbi:hypothetical protein DQ04_18911000, partial [Trypanosoma grayi]|uniref:hypothetical protein n=1 Tax=Trypanosoma grayi TaxID=71804 RepID=UPI0004F4AF21